jgi:leader peptidase (prepilin peptidase)/N-methyltransferase
MLYYLPLLILFALGGKLAIIDYQTHRLPNRIVGLLTVAQLAALGFLGLEHPDKFRIALATSLATLLTYSFLFLISRGALGMGDVKFSFPLGLTIGWYAPSDWLLTVLLTFVLAGLVSIIEIVIGRKTWKSKFAFGPYMYLTAILVIVIKLAITD